MEWGLPIVALSVNQLTSACVLLGALCAGCANQATTPPPELPSSDALQPLPPPSPAAVALAAVSTAGRQLDALPCPPPGLPPELSRYLDCAAMERFGEALSYAPRYVAPGSLPDRVDLRAHGLSGPTKDQEAIGACAGFAMSTVVDNAARRLGRRDVMAPLHVFSLYTLEDDQDFSRALRSRPITVEHVWPWDPVRACRMADGALAADCGARYGVAPGTGKGDPGLLAEKDRADRLGTLQIAGYEEMATEPVDLDQIALILASGEAIWAAIVFDRSAWGSLSRSGSDRMPYYSIREGQISHAVTLEGYRNTSSGREFLLHNSWGRRWGNGGFAWMHEQMLATHLSYAYRVVVADGAVPLQKPESHCAAGRVPLLDVCAPPLPSFPRTWASPGRLWTTPSPF